MNRLRRIHFRDAQARRARRARPQPARPQWETLESRELLTATITSNFAGSGFNGWIPPDTMGAVGPAHVVDFINDQVVVRDKTTGAALLSETGDQFWANAGVSGVSAYDNRITFDPVSSRWFASSDIDQGKANSRLIVGVSTDADPSHAWKAFTFASNASGSWGDFPTLGLDANGLYMTANLFAATNNSYTGSRVYAMSKAAVLNFAGGGATPTVTTWSVNPNDTMIAATDLNASKAATAPAYIANRNGSAIELRTVTWNGSTPSLSGVSSVSVPGASTLPSNGLQPGTNSQVLDAGDGRLNTVQVTNASGYLWTILPTTISGHAAGVWAQINLNTRTLTQSGQVADATADILDPAIAANDAGDALVGFTKVSSSQYASVYLTGRLGTDPSGTMERQVQVKAGSGTYSDGGGAGSVARWGDYSITQVDPTDPSQFWTYQEYATGSSNYQFGTQWARATLATAPADPGSFTATATSSSAIHLAWTDNADNETGYTLERSADGGNTWSAVTTTAANATSFDDSGLSAATAYSYRLTAVNNAARSASVTASATTSGTGQTLTAPLAPSNLAATAASATQINLTWTDNATNESGFKVYRSTDGGATYTLLAQPGAGATSYSDTGLTAGSTYSYYVLATNSAGDSAASNTASATTPASSLPATPTNLNAAGTARTTIQLTWIDNATNETGYYIERSNNGNNWTQIATVGADTTSYTVSNGLKRGGTYYFRVRAYNAAGTSDYSNVATAIAPRSVAFVPQADWPAYVLGGQTDTGATDGTATHGRSLNYTFTLVGLPGSGV